ncbi:MAG: hypothetical protein OEN21_18015 [Myxococcales bacterium]|nr:hypothetical protein [Myxococcales bacterium]
MSEQSPEMRVVDRFVDHGAPLSFRDLCARVLQEEHDYLILDLDKTTHLGRNLGELLAWELCAYEAYGESATGNSARRWFGGRLLLDWSQPAKLVRYLGTGARRWAWAGIYYLVWGKLASRIPALRRLAYSRFGPEPTTAVQRRPQMVALTHLATADEALLHDLARSVWRRHVSDQVIAREDLDWIRSRSPGIEIILSSASPKAMLDVAVEELGADGATYSSVERVNSGRAKIARLRETHPRVFDPDVKVLAITDTSYGEDHCWTEHFACVIDVNSPTPFAPIVTLASRTREVHSAILLTREERHRRNDGDVGYLDARRQDDPPRPRLELDRDALSARLGALLDAINGLSRRVPNPPRRWEIVYARTMLTEASRIMLT